MNKRLLLLGFVLVLLLAIPVTIYLVRTQTKPRVGAEASSILSLLPAQKTINVGDSFALDVQLDPGIQSSQPNEISFINLLITYPTNITLDQNQNNNNTGMIIHPVSGQTLVVLSPPSSPQCGAATCLVTVSLGVNPGQPITTLVPSLVTIYFKAQSQGDPNSQTIITLTGSKLLSTGSSDQPSVSVLATANSSTITINAPSGTPSPSPSGPADTPTDTPTPTTAGGGGGGGGGGSPTDTPTPVGGQAPTDTPTPVGGGTPTPSATASGSPICTSLTADKTTGNAPFSVNFTTVGNDTGSTISKITYNFGDGKVQDVTSGGGIGTTVVNSQISHSYANSGTFTASATFTDASGAISNPTNCSQTITVSAAIAKGPSPTIPASGPGNTIVNIGILGGVLSVLGAVFLFVL